MPASTRSARWRHSASTTPFPLPNLRRAVNRLLPPAIRVLSAEEAPAGFHPRFDALAKTYEYRILRGEICPPFEWPYVLSLSLSPGRGAHGRAGARRSKASTISPPSPRPTIATPEGKSKVRTIFSSVLERGDGRLTYRVRGSGFLKHMVRNIVGTLIEAGRGHLDAVDRMPSRCGPTAPAKGLFLVGVEYRRAS